MDIVSQGLQFAVAALYRAHATRLYSDPPGTSYMAYDVANGAHPWVGTAGWLQQYLRHSVYAVGDGRAARELERLNTLRRQLGLPTCHLVSRHGGPWHWEYQ